MFHALLVDLLQSKGKHDCEHIHLRVVKVMYWTAERPLKIGTRGSPLALAQAHETRSRLARALGLPENAFDVVVIKTTGDAVQDRPLGEIGGKGLFTKEIEEALLAGAIDIAVHSMKDMPVQFPDGLIIDCILPREDVRDAFISSKFNSVDDMPSGAVLGTSSLRRRAQLKNLRPDLEFVEFRGNVQTRLRKLSDGVADATFLAMAGLNRLDNASIAKPIDVNDILPAVAQGAIGIERRKDDDVIAEALQKIDHEDTNTRLKAERAFLGGLDGSCQTPIAGLADIGGEILTLRGEVIRLDGSEKISGSRIGSVSEAAALGADLAQELRTKMGSDFF